MLAIRKQLQPHSEWIYTVAVVLLCASRSAGLGETIASLLAIISLGMACVKVVLTDYQRRELPVGVILIGLAAVAYIQNGDKMLLMTLLVIMASKNVDLKKTLLMCLIVRVPLICIRILLAVTGVFPGGQEELVKTNHFIGYSNNYVISDYGFYHVNYLFFALFTLGVLLILVTDLCWKCIGWKSILAWVGYTLGLYFAYQLLRCRTGFYSWIAVLILLIMMQQAIRLNKQQCLDRVLFCMPYVLLISCVVFAYIRSFTTCQKLLWIDYMFSGRFGYFAKHISELKNMAFASHNYEKIDNAFFYSIYNYGYVFTILLVFVMTRAMVKLEYKKEYWMIVMLIACVIYMVGEAFPLSVAWNPVLILLSYGIFDEPEKRVKEKKQ